MSSTTRLQSWWQLPFLRGFFSFSASRYSTKFLVLIRLAIVARFLGPRELGLFGLATMVVAVAEVFTETGINLVLLKHPDKLKNYIHTAWAISIIRGVLITLAILSLSPLVSTFYRDDQLVFYLQVAALIPLIRGFINPAVISFQQELHFGKESLLRTSLQLVDILSGLALVLITGSGLGLIIGLVLSASVELVASFWIFKLWPNLKKVQFSLVKQLYAETRFIIGYGILNYLTEHADDFLIGRLLGTTGLGLYQTAYKWASAATIDIGYILGQTVYPIYARDLQQKRSIFRMWKISTLSMSAIFTAAGIVLLVFTEPFVRLILGEDWLSTVPAIRILFFAGVIKAFMHTWNPLVMLAEKLQHSIVASVIIMLVMLPAIYWLAPGLGITGASWGVLLALLVVLPYMIWLVWSSVQKLEKQTGHA